MRSFDIWDRYYDNQSKPLRGCIQFMVKDGNTSAPIYDKDGTDLANPQITDIYGRTEHQVFINEDVTAYFFKYIGHGTLAEEQMLGIDTSDQSKWTLQYTAENQQSYNTHLMANAATCVPSISALRALEVDSVPEVGGAIEITLLGYNAVGDKEPINYTWASGSTAADNGGSVIKCDDLITGRWIMTQPTEHCDTRHFGAFPQNSYNCPDQSYQIGQCCVYCMLHGLRVFFNGSMDYKWFRFSNMNVVVDAFDVTPDTRFYDAGNNTFQGDWNGNPRFTLGNTNIVGAKHIKTSWNAKSYSGYETVVIDQECVQKNWQDAHIDVQISPLYGHNFTHCTFELNGNLGSDNINQVDNTFNNCVLNEKMFILSGANVANLINCCTDCQIDLRDFKNAIYLYKQIRCTMDPNPYFDYEDLAPGLPFSMYTGNKITSTALSVKNMKNPYTEFNVIALGQQATDFILENCTGYYAFPANANVHLRNCAIKLAWNGCNLILDNSTVTLDSNAPGGNPGSITLINNSTINGEAGVTYTATNLSSRESNVGASIDVQGVGAYYRTVISATQYCAYADVKDCNVGADFYIYGTVGEQFSFPIYNEYGVYQGTLINTRYIGGNIKDNFVSGKIILNTPAGGLHHAANWLARGLVITNNNGLSEHPIGIYRGLTTQYEQYNNYIYKDNKGTFPGHHSMTVNWTSEYTAVAAGNFVNYLSYHGKIDNWGEPHTGETGHTDPNYYMTEFEMFTIGILNVRMKMTTYMGSTWIVNPQTTPPTWPSKWTYPMIGTTTVLDTVERSRYEYDHEGPTAIPWPKDLYWMGGSDVNSFTWRITKWYGFITELALGSGTETLNRMGPFEFNMEPISGWPDKT